MVTMRCSWNVAQCLLLSAIILSGCSKSTPVEDEDTDRTPPMAVTDLAVVSSTSQTAMLRWTTPMDLRDDQSGGMVDGYDLRVSFDSITAQNFAEAAQILPAPGPLPAGHVQQWAANDLTPDSVHYFALKSRDDQENWSDISNCVSAYCAAIRIVVFADPALEQAVRDQIGKPNGDILTTDVDTILQLVVSEAGVVSLSGLEYFSSLQVANFAWNQISDLSPVSGLTHLGGLYVSGNHISDLSPLAGMVSLRQIHLNDNPLVDISPLATIDSLQQLILWNTDVTDFSSLYNLYFLSDVGFNGMNLTDISFMAHLRRPQICGLAFNSITSVESLRGLYMLESLNLMQNQISDIGPLAPLVHLRELRLTNNRVTDLQALVNNTGLDAGDVLYLEWNPLSQYAIDWQVAALEARGVTVYH